MIPDIYENVTHIVELDRTAKDPFPEGSPLGITIHYTAGSTVNGAIDALVKSGLGYHLLIERDGSIYQTNSLLRKCWHAGSASWLGRSPNHHHIAIALSSWGYLTQDGVHFKTYTGKIIPKSQVSYRPDNATGRMYHWHEATVEQLAALHNALRWFVDRGIDPRNICGHDECALPRGRKKDPGGILPVPMSKIREEMINHKKGQLVS